MKELESHWLQYIGTGLSGDEEGARFGPSIMPCGSAAGWPHVKDIFHGISAKVDGGTPCCDWGGGIGPAGPGEEVQKSYP